MLSCISADYTRDYLVVILQKCTVHTSGEWTHFLAEILQMKIGGRLVIYSEVPWY